MTIFRSTAVLFVAPWWLILGHSCTPSSSLAVCIVYSFVAPNLPFCSIALLFFRQVTSTMTDWPPQERYITLSRALAVDMRGVDKCYPAMTLSVLPPPCVVCNSSSICATLVNVLVSQSKLIINCRARKQSRISTGRKVGWLLGRSRRSTSSSRVVHSAKIICR